MEDKERILDKIKKCLALSKSSNEHEAEAALRQARKLMDKHKLDMQDVAASGCSEEARDAKCKTRPSVWMIALASACAQAFGCALITRGGWRPGLTSGWDFRFIGVDAAPTLSSYAYEVLLRQLQRARREFVAAQKRVKLATKRRRGDEFANAWVSAVWTKIEDFAGGSDEEAALITAYKAKHYPNLKSEPLKRRETHGRDYGAVEAGRRAGRSAELHKPMGADTRAQLTAGG